MGGRFPSLTAVNNLNFNIEGLTGSIIQKVIEFRVKIGKVVHEK